MAINYLDIVTENVIFGENGEPKRGIEFEVIFQALSEELLSDVPPGGGLYSK